MTKIQLICHWLSLKCFMPWYNCFKIQDATEDPEAPSTSARARANARINIVKEAPEELLTLVIESSWSRWRFTVMLICCLIMLFYGLNLYASELLVPEYLEFSCIEGDLEEASEIKNNCFNDNGRPCTDFNYTQIYGFTITEKWHLICKHRKEVIISHIVFTCGLAFGSIVFGILADRWGRKRVLLICFILQPCCGILITTSGTIAFFTGSRFFYGIPLAGTVVVALILACEISSNKWRTFNVTLLCLSVSVGHTLVPSVLVGIGDSMKNILFLSLPQILAIFLTGIIKESPTWFLCRNQPNKAERVLKSVLYYDGVKVPSSFRIRPVQITNITSAKSIPLIKLLHPSASLAIILSLFVLSTFTSFTCGLVVGNILKIHQENILMPLTFLGITGICATIFSVPLNYTLKHNVAIALCSVVACLMAIITYIVHKLPYKFTLSLVVYGFFVTAHYSVWNIIPRIFPTEMRGEGTGITIAIAELSYMTARLISPHVYDTLGTLTTAYCASTCVILVCCTMLYTVHNRELPDKLEDSIKFKTFNKPVRWSTIRATSPTVDETEVNITDFERETSVTSGSKK